MLGLTILWVESDIGFYAELAAALGKRAPTLIFVWAADRAHASAALSVQRFDRFIIDVCLGDGLAGLDLIEDLRERGDRTPVIVLSDALTFGISRRIRALAGVDFLKKGVTEDLDGFIEVIRHRRVQPGPGVAKADDTYAEVARTFEAMPGKPAERLERLQRELLERARKSEPTLAAAARKVGIPRQSLVAKLKKAPF